MWRTISKYLPHAFERENNSFYQKFRGLSQCKGSNLDLFAKQFFICIPKDLPISDNGKIISTLISRVPTRTGKPGKMEKLFPVREFCADWKSQGNLDKILEKSGKLREFQFFVLFLIELYLLKWIKFSGLSGYPIWGKPVSHSLYLSPSTDSILGLLLTSYTIWVGWP